MKKLGIIDSGIGGLTLLQELISRNLDVEYLYISDNENVPYGEKSQSFMLERISLMITKLKEKSVDAILLACNTLTAHAIDQLRSSQNIKIFGIEPYINFANQNQNSENSYALIATKATIQSERFKKLQKKSDPLGKVEVIIMPKLALIIERMKESNLVDLKDELEVELTQLKNKELTHLILGCTHYPLITSFLSEYLSVKIVDPTKKVIDHIIKEMGVTTDNNKVARQDFYLSEDCGQVWEYTNIPKLKFLNLK